MTKNWSMCVRRLVIVVAIHAVGFEFCIQYSIYSIVVYYHVPCMYNHKLYVHTRRIYVHTHTHTQTTRSPGLETRTRAHFAIATLAMRVRLRRPNKPDRAKQKQAQTRARTRAYNDSAQQQGEKQRERNNGATRKKKPRCVYIKHTAGATSRKAYSTCHIIYPKRSAGNLTRPPRQRPPPTWLKSGI